MRHLVLHLGRVLGGGLDDHIPPLLRDRGGDLAFQVEMFLPADLEAALDHVRRRGDGPRGIALLPDDRPLLEPAVRGQGIVDRQQGG